MSGIDREEMGAHGASGLQIARGIPDHQNAIRCVTSRGCQCEVFRLGPEFLAGDDFDIPQKIMLLPFPDEGFSGSLGDADDVRVSLDIFQGIENPPERFYSFHGAGHGLVDRKAPLEESLQVRIPGFLHAFFKGWISKRKARFAEFPERPGGGELKACPADFGVIAKKLKCG